MSECLCACMYVYAFACVSLVCGYYVCVTSMWEGTMSHLLLF